MGSFSNVCELSIKNIKNLLFLHSKDQNVKLFIIFIFFLTSIVMRVIVINMLIDPHTYCMASMKILYRRNLLIY